MCSCGCGGSHKHDELVPMVGVITDIQEQTPDVKTFRVVSPRGRQAYLSICRASAPCWRCPAWAEAMFSITSSPTE